MILRRMLSADELRQRMATSGSTSRNETIVNHELVETDECLQLPVTKTIQVLKVLTLEDYADWCEDENINIQSLETSTYTCQRSLAPSGLLWPVSWDEEARQSRREECVRTFRNAASQDAPPPPLRPVPAGPAGQQELFARAAAALRAGSAAGMLPGREAEQEQVANFLRDAIRSGGRKEVLYVSGMPGTGKTASVLEVVRRLQARPSTSFEFAHVNAMCLSTPGAVFAEICRKIPSAAAGQRKRRMAGHGENQAQASLARFFTSGTSRKVVVLLIDEVDALVTQAQSVLYRLFDWLTRPGARLAVVAIANTMDLPERLLPRVSSRLGMLRLNFQPYNRAQLKTILANRLSAGQAEGCFEENALMICAARVAAGSGDARKALQVCRRAIEAQASAVAEGCRAPGPVTANEMTQAEADLLRANPAAMAVAGLGEKARRLLLAITLELRRSHSSALPVEGLIRRYEGIVNLYEELEAGSSACDHQRHVEEVHFLLRRLQAMSILSPLSKPNNSAGEDLQTTLELGESLDVDDVADALSAVEGDDIAKELLGFVAPPEPLKKVN